MLVSVEMSRFSAAGLGGTLYIYPISNGKALQVGQLSVLGYPALVPGNHTTTPIPWCRNEFYLTGSVS